MLAEIISQNVTVIQSISDQLKTPHPTLDDTYDSGSKAEQLTLHPEVLSSAFLAISAASQLIATLKLPGLSLLDRANCFHIPSAFRICLESAVAEILREGDPDGVDVAEIASKSGIDAGPLERALRLLATHYIFKETRPNVFANNRLSSMLDSGRSSATVLALGQRRDKPIVNGITNIQGEKYVGTDGITALLEQNADEVYKASAYIPDTVLSNDWSKTPFQRAFNLEKSIWDFYEEYPAHLQRIQIAMEGFVGVRPQLKLLKGFDWAQLRAGSLLVDVGGGNGSESYEIAKKAPHLKIIIEDREETVKQVTGPTWQAHAEKKSLLDSGRVSLLGQDFFDAQPDDLGKVAMFFMRFITHDWPTSDCVRILRRLHAAAAPDTLLLINDQVVPYACPTPPSLIYPGSWTPDVPSPLLANLGEASAEVYFIDFAMTALFNGQERTLGEFKEMAEQAGWKIEKVYQTVGSRISQVVCSKI
ncbi:S-adenosyl-L-methionine-dependent methyltransferase [Punctularia strigosozonata HHB-11173 SS5]|uniref:S-adenosyl-L-methionine-dependent methyltransferase n=1 Tax=Punctularia strigosozonata (strain HHB-11173) TaxID=741275 RepID=R7S1H1_PUNST|nr:S-adenosyl-L-methionine-dependent methyltransferase [Punctularia strigosozonata HHB-11173 SS5]EIN04073.1 S-adenosyl-L-methionine-dependent methyltransferase [Punctularia strigosozonata HHB-11173 SS5]